MPPKRLGVSSKLLVLDKEKTNKQRGTFSDCLKGTWCHRPSTGRNKHLNRGDKKPFDWVANFSSLFEGVLKIILLVVMGNVTGYG